MVTNLNDYLVRRTGRLYFERHHLGDLYQEIGNDLSEILQWTPEEKKHHIDAFEKEYQAVISWKN